VDLSSTQVALCTVSVFFILHFNYLGVRMHPPLPTGLELNSRYSCVRGVGRYVDLRRGRHAEPVGVVPALSRVL